MASCRDLAAGSAASRADALVPNDPRVQHLDAKIGSYNYHYMLVNPPNPIATVLLIHGFPDLGMSWRYQIPLLRSLNLRVIVPDMLGYGQTSAPDDHAEYTFSKLSEHMTALIGIVCGPGQRVILGGHDWGGAFVWGMAMRRAEVVQAVFSLNTPFAGPRKELVDGETLVQRVPSFRYQLQFASGEVEKFVDGNPERLRQFLSGMYGGVGSGCERLFSTDKGIIFENVKKIGPPALLTGDMLDHYEAEFGRHGLRGPLNWYRTRKLNYEDELPFANMPDGFKFKMPAMVVMGEKDAALPPQLADGMEKWFQRPLRKEVVKGVGHWGHWQDPEAVNRLIDEFLGSVVGTGSKGKL